MVTLLFSWFQGSPLKGKTCGRSQHFPPKSETPSCLTAQGAAGGTGHAPHQLPPLGTPLHPRCDQHGRLCPGRVSPLFVCISQVCAVACHSNLHSLPVMKSPVQPDGCTCIGSSLGWRGGGKRLSRVLLGQLGLGSPSLVFALLLKRKSLSEKMPLLRLAPCRGHKNTLGFFSG